MADYLSTASVLRLGAIISVVILILCLLLDVEKYEPEFIKEESGEAKV